MNSFSLENKLILITGASSGIGRQCAINCSKMGASVVLLGRNRERLKETQISMKYPENHLIYSVDLLEFDKISEIVKEIVLKKGKIYGLINNAGISTTLPLSSVSPAKMDNFFKTNVIGAVNLTRQVVKISNFYQKGGSLIFLSSVMGSVGEKGKSLYAMTKGAIISTVKSLALELACRNIRVNSISPGVVETPMSKNAIYSRNQKSYNEIINKHPLGLGTPEDIANACIYLLSDASRWVTGTNLIVDGGYLAK